jgi:hypothetical protein
MFVPILDKEEAPALFVGFTASENTPGGHPASADVNTPTIRAQNEL